MAKYQDIENRCPYVIFPLGKGLPLCLKKAVKEKKLTTVTIQDLDDCQRTSCPLYHKYFQMSEICNAKEELKCLSPLDEPK